MPSVYNAMFHLMHEFTRTTSSRRNSATTLDLYHECGALHGCTYLRCDQVHVCAQSGHVHVCKGVSCHEIVHTHGVMHCRITGEEFGSSYRATHEQKTHNALDLSSVRRVVPPTAAAAKTLTRKQQRQQFDDAVRAMNLSTTHIMPAIQSHGTAKRQKTNHTAEQITVTELNSQLSTLSPPPPPLQPETVVHVNDCTEYNDDHNDDHNDDNRQFQPEQCNIDKQTHERMLLRTQCLFTMRRLFSILHSLPANTAVTTDEIEPLSYACIDLWLSIRTFAPFISAGARFRFPYYVVAFCLHARDGFFEPRTKRALIQPSSLAKQAFPPLELLSQIKMNSKWISSTNRTLLECLMCLMKQD